MCQNNIFYKRADENELIEDLKNFFFDKHRRSDDNALIVMRMTIVTLTSHINSGN